MPSYTGSNFLTYISPPDRGSFPLDLERKCRHLVKEYVNCVQAEKQRIQNLESSLATPDHPGRKAYYDSLQSNQENHCRVIVKQYLACRMENGLMDKEELSNLGFPESKASNSKTIVQS